MIKVISEIGQSSTRRRTIDMYLESWNYCVAREEVKIE